MDKLFDGTLDETLLLESLGRIESGASSETRPESDDSRSRAGGVRSVRTVDDQQGEGEPPGWGQGAASQLDLSTVHPAISNNVSLFSDETLLSLVDTQPPRTREAAGRAEEEELGGDWQEEWEDVPCSWSTQLSSFPRSSVTTSGGDAKDLLYARRVTPSLPEHPRLEMLTPPSCMSPELIADANDSLYDSHTACSPELLSENDQQQSPRSDPDRPYSSDPDRPPPSDPHRPYPSDPDRPHPSDSNRPHPADPYRPPPSDPERHIPSDPYRQHPLDPDSFHPSDPNRAHSSDPERRHPLDPDRPCPSDPDRPPPSDPYRQHPSDLDRPQPSDPDRPRSSDPERPPPSDSYRQHPSDSYRQHPSDSYRPPPSDSYRQHPSDSYRPPPSDSYRQYPLDPDRPQSSDPDRPPPSDPYRQHPLDLDRPQPSDPDRPYPSDPDRPQSSDPNRPLPSDPDRPQPSDPDRQHPSSSDRPHASDPDRAHPSDFDKQYPSVSGLDQQQSKLSETIVLQSGVSGDTGQQTEVDLKDGMIGDREDLSLEHYNLPKSICEKYRASGVSKLFEWQRDCLMMEGVCEGRNLVYSAPTSAGKTLVSDILMLRRVTNLMKKAIVVVPFVALAREKITSLKKVCAGSEIRVDGFHGNHVPPGGLGSVDIAVCTIEKANSLVNRMMEENSLNCLSCVVVDELHLLGDSRRGFLLEILLTKLQYYNSVHKSSSTGGGVGSANDSSSTVSCPASAVFESATAMPNSAPVVTESAPVVTDSAPAVTDFATAVTTSLSVLNSSAPAVQLIGMSATLPNLHVLSDWLCAALFTTDFRPVPLRQLVKIGPILFNSGMKAVGNVNSLLTSQDDPDHLIALCVETVVNGHGVLVFCPTKAWCERLAVSIATGIRSLGDPGRDLLGGRDATVSRALRQQLRADRLSGLINSLKRCPAGLDPVLSRSTAFGVGFHHAGLTAEERDLVESAFRVGALRVLVATSTLSSGVNLPARRVIIRSPLQAGSLIDTASFRQMAGRAGRSGIDSQGECILVCRECDRSIALRLMTSSLCDVSSCLLHSDGSPTEGFRRALLEMIVSGQLGSIERVEAFLSCTLSGGCRRPVTSECVTWLIDNQLISQDEEGCLEGTRLGRAALASSLGPADSLSVLHELQKARRCFVLDSDLHLIYLMTPVYSGDLWGQIDWLGYLSMYEQLSPSSRRVADLVGVTTSFIVRALKGTINHRVPAQVSLLTVHKRFLTALALHELVNEVSLGDVASTYRCNRGALQSLQLAAATFAGMVGVFCERLGWRQLHLLLADLRPRLEFGVPAELSDLVRVSLLNGSRARALYSCQLHRLPQLANAAVQQVAAALKSTLVFTCNSDEEVSTRSQNMICVDGNHLSVNEAARLIIAQARALVQADLGMTSIKWQEMDTSRPAAAPDRVSFGSASSTAETTVTAKPGDQARSDSEVVEERVHEGLLPIETSSSPVPVEKCPGGHPSKLGKLNRISCQDGGSEYLPAPNSPNADGGMIESDSTRVGVSDGLSHPDGKTSPETFVDSSQNAPASLHSADVTLRPPTLADDSDPPRGPGDVGAEEGISKDCGQSEHGDLNSLHCDGADSVSNIRKNLRSPSLSSSPSYVSACDLIAAAESQDMSRGSDVDMFASFESCDQRPTQCSDNLHEHSMNFSDKVVVTPGLPPKNKKRSLRVVRRCLDHEMPVTSLSSSLVLADGQLDDPTLAKECRISVSSRSVDKPGIIGTRSQISVVEEGLTVNDFGDAACLPIKNDELLPRENHANYSRANVDSYIPMHKINEATGTQCYSTKANMKYADSSSADTTGSRLCRADSVPRMASSISVAKSVPPGDIATVTPVSVSDVPNTSCHMDDLALSLTDMAEADVTVDVSNSSSTMKSAVKRPRSSSSDRGLRPRRSCRLNKGPRISSGKSSSRTVEAPVSPSSMVFTSGSAKGCSNDGFNPYTRNSSGSRRKIASESSPNKYSAVKKLVGMPREGASGTSESEFEPVTVYDVTSQSGDVTDQSVSLLHVQQQAKAWNYLVIVPVTSATPGGGGRNVGAPSSARDTLSGLNLTNGCRLQALALSPQRNTVYHISLETSQFITAVLLWLSELLSRRQLCVTMFQSRFWLLQLLPRLCWWPQCRLEDPAVARWLLHPDLAADVNTIEALARSTVVVSQDLLSSSASPDCHQRAVASVRMMYMLLESLTPRLKLNTLWNCYKNIETRMVFPLVEMQLCGLAVDVSELDHQMAVMRSLVDSCQRLVDQAAGYHVDLASPKQVKKLLFTDLALPVAVRSRTGRPASGRRALARLQQEHPVVSAVVSWRKLTHVISQLASPLLRGVRSCDHGVSRVTCDWQTDTVTGRLVTCSPMLQNVPRPFAVAVESGNTEVALRRAFIASPGARLISADYCQLELRLLTHYSEDQTLTSMLTSSQDPFTSIAAHWSGIPVEQVTCDQRHRAKSLCYAVIYGMGDRSLADQLSVSEEEAHEFQAQFFNRFPGIRSYLSRVVEECRCCGYVTTLLGRRRDLSAEINSRRLAVRTRAERRAVNTTIQGSAADIVKLATVDLHAKLFQQFSSEPPGGACCDRTRPRIVLHLHDELILEVLEADLKRVVSLLRSCMCDVPVRLRVPLSVRLKTGNNWSNMLPLDIT